MRVAIGGLRHESNTFVPVQAAEADFAVYRGAKILDLGSARLLGSSGVKVIPTTLAGAPPFGLVKQSAYELFKEEILEGIRRAGSIQGVLLEMHGALLAEGYVDAQADLVNSIRRLVGPDVLICASFDSHGNISESFAAGMNILTAYRTAPHIDGKETRDRAVKLLLEAMRRDLRPTVAHVNVPILVPGEKGVTAVEPLKSIYDQLPEVSSVEGLLDASIFIGFAWSDVPFAGMSVQVVAESEKYLEKARREAQRLAFELWKRRAELDFDVPVDDIDGAIETALQAPETVFITDSGDNASAGAAGDSTLVLERLMAHEVRDAVVAGIVDPDAVMACEAAGVGASVDLVVGGKIDTVFGAPLRVKGRVHYLKPADEIQEEAGKSGIGPRRAAVIDVDGILAVFLDARRSFTSPVHFREVGIDPLAHKIVVVKSGYLFQALREIAPMTIMALTPGFAYQVVEELSYKNVRRPIYPLDPEMTWTP